MGGGRQNSTTTTRVELTPEQRGLIDLGTPGIEQTVGRVNRGQLNYPDVQPFQPAEVMGQNYAIGSVPGLSNLASHGADATRFLTSGQVLYPGSNPALASTIDAATRPILESATEQLLPAIRRGAIGTGNFGGSRSDILQQNAIRDVERNIGDTAAKIAFGGYQSGLEGLQRGIALTPTTQQSQLFPASVLSGVGAQRRGLAEQQAQREFEQEIAPLTFGLQGLGAAGAVPGAGTSVNAQTPTPGASPLNLLGLGLTGLSLVNPLFGALGAGANAANAGGSLFGLF